MELYSDLGKKVNIRKSKDKKEPILFDIELSDKAKSGIKFLNQQIISNT